MNCQPRNWFSVGIATFVIVMVMVPCVYAELYFINRLSHVKSPIKLTTIEKRVIKIKKTKATRNLKLVAMPGEKCTTKNTRLHWLIICKS